MEVERIQARMAEARSQVYASVIHDINGPLTVISGFASILSDSIRNASEITGQDLSMTKDYVARIGKQVEACVRVSQRYLGYYRGKRDKQNTAKINQAIEDARELINSHPAIGENQIAFDLLETEKQIRINGADLIQILINLSLSALQSSTKAHAVRVTPSIETQIPDWSDFVDEPGVRRVTCGTPGSTAPMARISVTDNGDGIPQQILEQLFRRQLTTKADKKGTGLGLAIIKRMMDEAGGAIEIISRPGQGTTFHLYFSLA